MSSTTDYYLVQANENARAAAAAELPNVKERCLRAEAAWRAMAERAARMDQRRKQDAEAKQAVPQAFE
ncbi:MAG: hypothetical protein J0G94_08555 [Sphingomonadales bacterium]|nr:hypothetical protein [Sphingomonadales bacterium]